VKRRHVGAKQRERRLEAVSLVQAVIFLLWRILHQTELLGDYRSTKAKRELQAITNRLHLWTLRHSKKRP